jgi:peptidoglycan/xylan/chitin deacetylase (PgdA/CDA1 family)
VDNEKATPETAQSAEIDQPAPVVGEAGTADKTDRSDNAGDPPQSSPPPSAGDAAPPVSTTRQFRLRPVAMVERPVRTVVGAVRRSPRRAVGAGIVFALALGVVVTATVPTPPAATLANVPATRSSASASSPATPSSNEPTESASPSPSPSATTTPRPSPTSPTPTRMAPPPRERVGAFPGTAPTPTLTTTTSAAATSSATATAPATPTTSAPQPGTLEYYLAQIPSFPARPAPAPVTFSHPAGQAAILESIPTSQNVAFLSIDDGFLQSSLIRELIRQSGIPVAIFLTTSAAADNPGFFQGLLHSGMVIDNHTVTHPDLATLTYEEQRAEICAASDQIQAWYGRRPTNLRPPYLSYNADTARAAWDCGITAIVNANVGVAGGTISYAYPDRKIHRGDIIVFHFDSTFAEDFIAALWAVHAAGLTPALLTDYISVA